MLPSLTKERYAVARVEFLKTNLRYAGYSEAIQHLAGESGNDGSNMEEHWNEEGGRGLARGGQLDTLTPVDRTAGEADACGKLAAGRGPVTGIDDAVACFSAASLTPG